MNSQWNDAGAAQFSGPLGERVYSSRLLGRDPSLVLHGGGNTSVKLVEKNLFGEDETVLYVKGSGWDLDSIEAQGFAPVRLEPVRRLAMLEHLTDLQMADALRMNTLRGSAPAPSVEAILHATLPYRYVDHTHADAVISITNSPDGEQRIRELYGDDVVVVPYVMPGFRLARQVALQFPREAHERTIGLILMQHGVFSFGETAREAYERMIALVDRAEQYLKRQGAWEIVLPESDSAPEKMGTALAELRQAVSRVAGAPMILTRHDDPLSRAFARRPDVASLSQRGPATPDHIIRTKQKPLVGRDVGAFVEDYRAYFEQHEASVPGPLTMLDPAPRIILDPEFGMVTVGRTAHDARIGADIYSHTIGIILRAEALGGWQALPPEDLFEMEYWDLEQAKLRRQGKPPSLTGEIALVTGAASGIGKACVESLLARGAAVVGLDLNPAVSTQYDRPAWLGIPCDITDEGAVQAAIEAAARRFGGLDILILNAGIFPKSMPVKDLPLADWQRVLDVNLTANLTLLRESYPLLRLAPNGGKVVVIGSKNVPAPGPGVASYSASKAALNQLARVVALEWGKDRIRVNTIHPNAVFDTALWNDDLLALRAQHYGMTVEEYRTNNVMRVEITSHDVGEMAAAMCEPLFAKTTGAQVPIDGGNERVI